MRFTSVCTTANTEPTTSVSKARTRMAGRQSSMRLGNAIMNTRMSAANAATLPTEPISAVIGVGAPWYTSGVHTWKGTRETLNAKPTSSNAMPASNKPLLDGTVTSPANTAAIDCKFVVPDAPNNNATPYKKNAEAKPPRMKYLRPASPLCVRLRLDAVSK